MRPRMFSLTHMHIHKEQKANFQVTDAVTYIEVIGGSTLQSTVHLNVVHKKTTL